MFHDKSHSDESFGVFLVNFSVSTSVGSFGRIFVGFSVVIWYASGQAVGAFSWVYHSTMVS